MLCQSRVVPANVLAHFVDIHLSAILRQMKIIDQPANRPCHHTVLRFTNHETMLTMCSKVAALPTSRAEPQFSGNSFGHAPNSLPVRAQFRVDCLTPTRQWERIFIVGACPLDILIRNDSRDIITWMYPRRDRQDGAIMGLLSMSFRTKN